MDLVKKNIHMDRVRVSTVTQFSLDEDMNLPENKADCSMICFTGGFVETEDVKPVMDEIRVNGNLHFCILYHTEEPGCELVRLENKIPFEEKIHLQGVKPSDMVQIDSEVEDLTVSMINSRKLNVRSVINMKVKAEELYDEEITIGIHAKEPIEYRRNAMDIARICIQKKDVFRLKEEFTLPANYPNIFQILWSDVNVKDVEFKLQNGRIGVQGEAKAFVMYEAEGEAHDILFFERNLPFGGVIDCQGCKDSLIPDIRYHIAQREFCIRPDEDGEERKVGLEMVLELKMNLYEEEPVEMITDIYGVGCEVMSQCKDANLYQIRGRVGGKMKLEEKVRVKGRSGGILQVVHGEGDVALDEVQNTAQGLQLSGLLNVRILFITGEDSVPYSSVEEQLPFRYVLELPGLQKEDYCNVQAFVEQLQIQLLDGEEMEVRANLGFNTTAFHPVPAELVQSVEVTSLDAESWNHIPGVVVYVVKQGDTLWNIGKRYYIPVEQIKSLNNLESDHLQIGRKLLIVKGGIG